MKNKEIFTLYRYVRILLMHWGLDCYMWQIDREIERDRKWNQKTRDHENLNILKKWSSRSSFTSQLRISLKFHFASNAPFPVRSSLLLRPSKYSLHGGEEDRAREILHRGCSRNFVVLTSRDIFYGKPPFFLRPSPLQRDRTSSLHDI